MVRKCVKRCVFSTPNFRTAESVGKLIKNRPKRSVCIFGSPNIAPRYAINKIKKISLGRFFKIFLIVYSRIRHACLWALPTKTALSYGTYAPISALWRIRLGRYSQIKKSGKTRFVYFGSPNRIRTGVLALKGRCPRPLDDGAKTAVFISNAGKL